MNHSHCKEPFDASKALLCKSGLIRWDGETFVPVYTDNDDSKFKKYCKEQFHPRFGRYMAWVLFSIGAENLVKAAYVCSKDDSAPLKWNLGRFTPAKLVELCKGVDISDCGKDRLTDGYKLLKRVRNRDLHIYVRDVRGGNFSDVKATFVPAFKILVEVMKRKHHTVHSPLFGEFH